MDIIRKAVVDKDEYFQNYDVSSSSRNSNYDVSTTNSNEEFEHGLNSKISVELSDHEKTRRSSVNGSFFFTEVPNIRENSTTLCSEMGKKLSNGGLGTGNWDLISKPFSLAFLVFCFASAQQI